MQPARRHPRCVTLFLEKHTAPVTTSSRSGRIGHANACVRLGAQTQALCERVVNSEVLTLGIAQLALIVLMKTGLNKGPNLLWSLPLIAAALRHAYGVFPTYSRSTPD